MPRGGHKMKPAKAPQVEDVPSKPSKTTISWKTSISAPSFRSRNDSVPVVRESTDVQVPLPSFSRPTLTSASNSYTRCNDVAPLKPFDNQQRINQVPSRPSSSAVEDDQVDNGTLDTLRDLMVEETHSSCSSSYSRDSMSIYSRDSASIYSGTTSIYSFDEYGPEEGERTLYKRSTDLSLREGEAGLDSSSFAATQHYSRARPAPLRRQETLDVASQERSTLAKKAALFKNSRLSPKLPAFATNLQTWSLICRGLEASQDCYDSRALTRRGTYTQADSSKDVKAMIVDDQFIDESRVIIVAIRGTECQSLTDWAVNKAAKPVKPTGFLDDEENACHAGFLQVTKAMISQVASQLRDHPATLENASLLFTGHSAGGAVAALLYGHMLSKTVESDLTALASKFSKISCVTFGAPPLSLEPLTKPDHVPGIFIAMANEGDPVLRLSNAAYVKSLAKLMTASPPSTTTAVIAAPPPPVKVVRGSRGATVYRQAAPVAPPTPWEELPMWPTPPAPLTNAGDVILLRDKENGLASASRVTTEDLKDVIFGDLAQHTTDMYVRRVNQVVLAAMSGRDGS